MKAYARAIFAKENVPIMRSGGSFGLINDLYEGLCSREIGTSYPGVQIAPVTARKKSPKLDLGDRGEDIAYPWAHSLNASSELRSGRIDCQFHLTHATKQYSRVSCLTQTGFADSIGKEVQLLISGSPTYAETRQRPRLTTSSGILATS